MQKTEAIHLLGGSIKSAARRIGITTQAIGGWPDELTPAIRDRVQAALWRAEHELRADLRVPASPATQHIKHTEAIHE